MEINTQHFKFEPEAAAQFVLPVLDQARRAEDEHAPRFAASDEFADYHARFDRFAQADFVGDEQAAARHLDHVVSEQDLMGQ